MSAIITPRPGDVVATPDGWLRWTCTNMAPALPFESRQGRQVLPDVAWLIEPEEGCDAVHFGLLQVDHVTGQGPRRLELRRGRPGETQIDGRRGPPAPAGPDGPLVRTLEVEPGRAIDSRQGSGVQAREMYVGGLYIALVAQPSTAVTFHVLFLHRHLRSRQ